jgi:hypothetical protein
MNSTELKKRYDQAIVQYWKRGTREDWDKMHEARKKYQEAMRGDSPQFIGMGNSRKR